VRQKTITSREKASFHLLRCNLSLNTNSHSFGFMNLAKVQCNQQACLLRNYKKEAKTEGEAEKVEEVE